MTTRTTHRSTAGKKLYAVRGKDGRFKDVQRYKRAHAQDLRTRSREECARKVGLLLDAARQLRWYDGGYEPNEVVIQKKFELMGKVCAASEAADAAIVKACKARARGAK